MTVYLDLVFFLNFFFDFCLLLGVNNTLKRNAKVSRLLLASLFGSLSFFTLFIPMSSIGLFVFKILLSFLMCGICFGWKDKTYVIQNMSYFYMISVILGGFLYFLSLEFSESKNGLAFTYQEYTIPYLVLVIISPVMIYIYYKQRKEVKNYSSYYQVSIVFLNGKKLNLQSFLDTGNKLVDPITKKHIILVKENLLKEVIEKRILYVPYHTLNHEGLIECIPIDYLELNQKKSKNYLVGISKGNLIRDGIDCILNSYCLEEFL